MGAGELSQKSHSFDMAKYTHLFSKKNTGIR